MPRAATTKELCEVAQKAIAVFASHGLECCLTGGTACALYGGTRRPNDLDLVVLTDTHQREDLEAMLLAPKDTEFYLIAPKGGSGAGEKVLCYKLARMPGESRRGCKVNIFVPRAANYPDIPPERLERCAGLPCLPLILLLFVKLQSWCDHREFDRWYVQAKQDDNVRDIDELLAVVRGRGLKIHRKELLQWLPLTVVDVAMYRISEYARSVPSSITNWGAIGYQAYGQKSSIPRA